MLHPKTGGAILAGGLRVKSCSSAELNMEN
jgi:hypothetical protein